MDFFNLIAEKELAHSAPLAERMKPKSLGEFQGQSHIVGNGRMLSRMIEADRVTSIILYGPPGSGKTSLARIVARSTSSEFVTLNAVTSGVKDIREQVEAAKDRLGLHQKRTILFIDEIHRFNKTQQDALLPFVENGTVVLIGATTENPYYEVNAALVSRATLFRLQVLTEDEISAIVDRALTDTVDGLGNMSVALDDEARFFLTTRSGGDARKALNALELAALTTQKVNGSITISLNIIQDCMQDRGIAHDKSGDSHYDVASAFIKSVRGSDPDAALHYLARMIVGGEDPTFIARRLMILASEDIGNADPQALLVAVAACETIERIGMPEGRITLAQATTYLACAPKSNAAYLAIDKAIADIQCRPVGSMPFHLKDGTSLSMTRKHEGRKDLLSEDEKVTYKYAHDYPNHYVDQQYLPDALLGTTYYEIGDLGYESRMKTHMEKIRMNR